MSTTPTRPRPTFRTVQVTGVRQVTPHCIAITLAGEELRGYASKGPAEHIKIFFPPEGHHRPVVPEWGPNGPVVREGAPRPVSRTYTPRRWNPETNELEVHFMTHSNGPGATWARSARPGDVVVIAGPGRPFAPPADARHFLIAGDESALPAIGTILENLSPEQSADVFVEVAAPEEEQPLSSPGHVRVRWLHRSSASADAGLVPGKLLESAVASADDVSRYDAAWIACEAGVMRSIRRRLLYEHGFRKEALVTRGYWKMGVANHPDHDMGEDV